MQRLDVYLVCISTYIREILPPLDKDIRELRRRKNFILQNSETHTSRRANNKKIIWDAEEKRLGVSHKLKIVGKNYYKREGKEEGGEIFKYFIITRRAHLDIIIFLFSL